jgi:hypothetical protein
MMSHFLRNAFIALVLCITSVADVRAAAWSEMPCRSIIADKYGGTVPTGAELYIAASGLQDKFGSNCNLDSFIVAECRLHPHSTEVLQSVASYTKPKPVKYFQIFHSVAPNYC